MKRLSLLFSCALFFMAQGVAQALSLPTPAPTTVPSVSIPHHIKTYVQLEFGLNSCYHVSGADSFNSACNGSPGGAPTPGPSGSFGDWSTLSNYIDYVETNLSGMDVIASSGIKVGAYGDAAIPHGYLDFDPGVSAMVKGYSPNQVCPNNYPADIQLSTSFYGVGIYAPTMNVASCNGNYYGSIFGDVKPSAVSAWKKYIENNFYQMPMYGLGGFGLSVNNDPALNGLSFWRWDDHEYPAYRFSNAILCINAATSLGTSSAGATVTTCSDSRINSPQATVASHRYFHMHPYPDYMDHDWITGTQNLFRMPRSLGLETHFNDGYDPLKWPYFNTYDHSNVAWEECEGCITRNGYASNVPWPVYSWRNHMDTEITANEMGVGFHAFHPTETNSGDIIKLYASLMLASNGDPSLLMTSDSFSGSLTAPNSQIHISPMVYLVATQPINTPANFYFNPMAVGYNPTYTGVYPFGIGSLKQSGGAYLREFAACYNTLSGTNIGPCAAVVNPDPSNTAVMPATVNTYTHTASFTGSGIITPTTFGGGDTGALTTTASAAPSTGGTIAANTAYILTP